MGTNSEQLATNGAGNVSKCHQNSNVALVGPSEYKLFSPSEYLVGLVLNVFRFPKQSEPREEGSRRSTKYQHYSKLQRGSALSFPCKNKLELYAACLVGGESSADAVIYSLLENRNLHD